jgi:hypothetical protein
MPTIDRFKGIKTQVYNGEHYPPHIHARYHEHEALIMIESGTLYSGYLPARQMKELLAWLNENTQWVQKIFEELNPEQR